MQFILKTRGTYTLDDVKRHGMSIYDYCTLGTKKKRFSQDDVALPIDLLQLFLGYKVLQASLDTTNGEDVLSLVVAN